MADTPPNLMDHSPDPSFERKASPIKPSGGPRPPPGLPGTGPDGRSPGYSPWTSRFAAQHKPHFTWDNTIHSGFAPEIPRVDDPVHSLDTSFMADPFYGTRFKLDHEDLDILFRTESFQADRLLGMRTWQAPALHRWVKFGSDRFGPMSGGHLPTDIGADADRVAQVYRQERIKVDESKWFLFLQRRRWYDWIEQKPPGKVQGRVWSVDDSKVWAELSIVLELVNRMFKALIEDRNEAGR